MPPHEIEIVISHGGEVVAQQILAAGKYVIGRAADADIQLDVPLVSRQHARLTLQESELTIEDLASTHGTSIDGRRLLQPTRCETSQKIYIGEATIEVRSVPAPSKHDLSPSEADLAPPPPPSDFPKRKYEAGEVVARGGMGAILSARDPAIHRNVAMKIMLESESPENAARFIEEARITGQLEHPNIVPIYELASDEHGQPYYTMKFVHGLTLRKVIELLAEGLPTTLAHYSLATLLTIFQKVCDALAFAHSRGVIHRDLKPDNIMLGDFGEVLVMDWGLAKTVDSFDPHRCAPQVHSRRQEDGSSFTMAGTVMGTPRFMSPEQASGEVNDLDARTDIYALGAILFQFLTLRPAIEGRSSEKLLAKARAGELTPFPDASTKLPHLPGGRVPDSLRAVCLKAMALDRDDRYPDVPSLQQDIAAYQAGFATRAENAGLGRQLLLALQRHQAVAIAIAASLVLLIAVSAVFVGRVLRERNRAERALSEVGQERDRTAQALEETSQQRDRAALALGEAGRQRDRAEQALSDLRKAAPTLAAQAEILLREQKTFEALAHLDFAITIDPEHAGHRLRRAQLLQSALRLDEAQDAFRAILDLQPDNTSAKANLALTQQLLAQKDPSGALPPTALRRLYDALRAENRIVESVPLAQSLGLGSTATTAAIEAAVQGWKTLADWNAARINRLSDGTFFINLEGLPIHDLSPFNQLRGLPISKVRLVNTLIQDLAPLAGLPLRDLAISNTPIADLAPLRGLGLQVLDTSYTKITSIEPLRGMPLRWLSVGRCPQVADLAPLKGMPLEVLDISLCRDVKSLEPLRGMRLRTLRAYQCANAFPDLEILRGMPLEHLSLYSAPMVRSLTPLRGMPLKVLELNATNVADLSPLLGMRLEHLELISTPVTDLSPLAGMPLRILQLLNCRNLRDLRPCASLTTLTQVTLPKGADPTPLRHLPALERLSERARGPAGDPAQTAGEFWSEYDARMNTYDPRARPPTTDERIRLLFGTPAATPTQTPPQPAPPTPAKP